MKPMLTGQKLRAIRHLRGWSQSELAEKAGYEPGVRLPPSRPASPICGHSTIAKLCEALGVTVTYKIDGTEISGP